jgi:uncharacterized protein with PIN domain
MKKLTFVEFQDRLKEVSKARAIFIKSGITDDLTVAFTLYQTILADEEKKAFVSTTEGGKRPVTFLDDYERPKCPECQTDLMLQMFAKDEALKVWPTAWVCTNCKAEFYSEKTLEDWTKELKKNE